MTTVLAKYLRRTLTAALPGACLDESLPDICGVHLTVVKGLFMATATDRYVAVHAKAPTEGDLAEAFVTTRCVKLMLNVVQHVGPNAPVELERRDGNKLALTAEGIMLEIVAGSLERWPAKTLRSVLSGASHGRAASKGGEEVFNPLGRLYLGRERLDSLHRVLKASTRGDQARWRTGDGRSPVLVDVDDWLLVAVMPMRYTGDGPDQHVIYGIPEPAEPAPLVVEARRRAPRKKVA